MPNREQANILIVDNQPENLLVMENLLEGSDCHVVQARSASEALALMFDHEFSVVVLDVSVPELKGIEVAEVLRRSQKTREIPILFITAPEQEHHRVFEAHAGGTVDYLVKPLDAQNLQCKVNIFVELFRHRQSLKRTSEALERTVIELEQANRKIIEHQKGIIEEERLKVLLQMAGATAHEINQPLMTLLGHIELLKSNKDNPDKVGQRIDTIQQAGQKISEIVNRMQTPHSPSAKSCLQEKPVPGCGHSLRILCVEPSELDFQRIKAMLKHHTELQLNNAAGISEAFDHLASQPADVILLEHRLRDGNAFDFLKTLADQGLTTLPVVVVTGNGDELLASEVMQAGAYDYISKNWLSDTCLLRSIHNAFEKCRLKKEMEQLVKRMAEMSTKDELTGLYNRRYFTEALEREMARAKRYGSELALCLIDLDHFKTINDTFGHPAGDAALAHLGTILSESIRQSDLACRYGGDEFAIILPNASRAEATAVCERIRELVANYQFPYRALSFRLTTSIGVAIFDPSHHQSAVDLISSTDQALYGSKREGRNGVTWSDFQPRRDPSFIHVGNGSPHPGSLHNYPQNVAAAR